MQIPSSVPVAAAVIFALPCGWGIGLLAAWLIGGRNFGQLPVATVPIGLLAALAFALWPSINPGTRLKVTLGGSIAFFLFAWLVAR